MTGTGTTTDPLKVAVPLSQAEKNQIGTRDSANQIITKLQSVSGNDRLDASAIKDLPEGGLSSVSSDGTLSGDGTSANPLSVVSGGGGGLSSVASNSTLSGNGTRNCW